MTDKHGAPGKGSRKKGWFRTSPKGAKNKILYGWCLANKVTTKELAIMVGVNHRTAQRWIFDGVKPLDTPMNPHLSRLCKITGLPENILFFDLRGKS